MLGILTPKDQGFFENFNRITALICDAATEFKRLASDSSATQAACQRIKSLENDADNITHETMNMLHKTFITPLDREDIHQLVKRLDDILDFIDAAAQRILLYKVDHLPVEMQRLADVNLASAELVKITVAGLKDLKHSDGLLKHCVEINRLENEADQFLRQGVPKLFEGETDIKRLIKLKEIFELLETVTDRCEDVANVIESIFIEYS